MKEEGSRNDARGKVVTMCGVPPGGYISKQCSCLEVWGEGVLIKPLQAHQIISIIPGSTSPRFAATCYLGFHS